MMSSRRPSPGSRPLSGGAVLFAAILSLVISREPSAAEPEPPPGVPAVHSAAAIDTGAVAGPRASDLSFGGPPVVAEELPLLRLRREGAEALKDAAFKDRPTTRPDGAVRYRLAPADAPGPVMRFRSRLEEAGANLFRYSRLAVRGNYRVSDDEILRRAALNDAPWMWQTSREEIERRVKENPWIESVSLEKSFFPLTLTVDVVEAEPWIIAEYDHRSWIVSRSGNLVQTLAAITDSDLILETTELPRLDGLQPQPLSGSLSSANARFLFAVRSIKLLRSAGDLPFEVGRYRLLPAGGLVIHPADDATLPQIVLLVQTLDDAETALGRLKAVLADLSKRGERPRRIDLRFDRQVVIE